MTLFDNIDHYDKYIVAFSGGKDSTASKYAIKEADKADNRGGTRVNRFVDRLRPIRDWTEKEVWAIIERWKVRVHPAYYLGFSRCSCQFCIFGNADQFASAYKVSPEKGERLIADEACFDMTMKRSESLAEYMAKGTPYPFITEELTQLANAREYHLPIFMEEWKLPSGAFGKSCGPA